MGQPRPDLQPRPVQPPRRPTVLIVDDDQSLRDTLEVLLRPQSYRVLKCEGGALALDVVRRQRVDVVFLDVHLGTHPDGFEVLEQLRGRFPEVEVIMCSVDRDVQAAVRAIKLGAFDYLTKDFGSLSRAIPIVENALVKQGTQREQAAGGSRGTEPGRALDVGMVAGKSPRMRELLEVVVKVAPSPARVLIQGESGTGKEVLAHLIHRWSDRADRPFVGVNVTAIPSELMESALFGHEKGAFTGAHKTTPGRFELAHGGTLFLDEIGLLPLPLQSKLLRVLQERELERVGGTETLRVDVRLIAATNVDLMAAVRAGRFRDDLYYRLNVIPLKLPPLRERREEIPELARFFVRKYAARLRREAPEISEEAMARMIAYDWPGNVRELENVVERLVTVCERQVFSEDDLPLEVRGAVGFDETPAGGGDLLQVACETFERNFLARALDRHNWNKAACARYLGISYATMKNKVAKYMLVEPLASSRRHPGPLAAGSAGLYGPPPIAPQVPEASAAVAVAMRAFSSLAGADAAVPTGSGDREQK